MKIERPDWLFDIKDLSPENTIDLDTWFDQNVTPVNKLLAEAKRLYLSHDENHGWVGSEKQVYEEGLLPDTHQGLLLDLKPIERESAEDVLRALIAYSEKTPICKESVRLLGKRAKAVLSE